jgi:hypothetical protein
LFLLFPLCGSFCNRTMMILEISVKSQGNSFTTCSMHLGWFAFEDLVENLLVLFF